MPIHHTTTRSKHFSWTKTNKTEEDQIKKHCNGNQFVDQINQAQGQTTSCFLRRTLFWSLPSSPRGCFVIFPHQKNMLSRATNCKCRAGWVTQLGTTGSSALWHPRAGDYSSMTWLLVIYIFLIMMYCNIIAALRTGICRRGVGSLVSKVSLQLHLSCFRWFHCVLWAWYFIVLCVVCVYT